MRPGYVYFIQAEQGGPIKIGRAWDPEKRIREVQCGNPYRLVLRHAEKTDDPSDLENRLHRWFAEYRMEGEWFQAHPVIADLGRCIPDPGLADAPAPTYPEFKPPTQDEKERYWQRKMHRPEVEARMKQEREEFLEYCRQEEERLATDYEYAASKWSPNGEAITVIPDEFLDPPEQRAA